MITCLFYIVLLIQPFGCKNPINHEDDDDDDDDDEQPYPPVTLYRPYCPSEVRGYNQGQRRGLVE